MAKSEHEHTKLVSAWTPRPLAEQLEQRARENERSVSAELRVAIRQHLRAERKTPKAAA